MLTANVMLLAPLALMLPNMFRAEHATTTLTLAKQHSPGMFRAEHWRGLAIGMVIIGVISGMIGHQFFDVHTVTVLRSWLVMGGLTLLALQALPVAYAPGSPRSAEPEA